MAFSITRYHDFSMGHRVLGHEGKCRYLHGHNYRAHFTVEPAQLGYLVSNELGLAAPTTSKQPLDTIGRVIDFSILKTRLCDWIEEHWDHRMLLFDEDPLATEELMLRGGVVTVPFNPTAENLAHYLVHTVGPMVLPETVVLVEVRLEETRKCSATCVLDG